MEVEKLTDEDRMEDIQGREVSVIRTDTMLNNKTTELGGRRVEFSRLAKIEIESKMQLSWSF